MPLTKVSDVMLDSGGTGLPMSSKGEMVVHDGSLNVPIVAPEDGQILVGRPGSAQGVSWQDPSAVPEISAGVGGHFVGQVVMGAVLATPTRFLPCDGAAASRTTYALLYAALGGASSPWGQGNGTTTFNVPDLRGRSPMGSGTGFYRLTISAINTTSNVLTVTASDLRTGAAVVYTTTAPGSEPEYLPGPLQLVNGGTYYWIFVSPTTGMLAQTRILAVEGTPINLSTVGSGTQTLQVNLTARTMGQIAGEENHTLTVDELAQHSHNNGYDTTGATQGGDPGRGAGATTVTGLSAEHNTVHPVAMVGFFIYAGV